MEKPGKTPKDKPQGISTGLRRGGLEKVQKPIAPQKSPEQVQAEIRLKAGRDAVWERIAPELMSEDLQKSLLIKAEIYLRVKKFDINDAAQEALQQTIVKIYLYGDNFKENTSIKNLAYM